MANNDRKNALLEALNQAGPSQASSALKKFCSLGNLPDVFRQVGYAVSAADGQAATTKQTTDVLHIKNGSAIIYVVPATNTDSAKLKSWGFEIFKTIYPKNK